MLAALKNMLHNAWAMRWYYATLIIPLACVVGWS